MKIACVVQRYGADIVGGSEQLCRTIAERLSRSVECEVLTTCARDYMTWADEFSPGTSKISGVTVRRFSVDNPRDVKKFNKFSEKVMNSTCRTAAEEKEWMKLQGPYSSRLLEYIECSSNQYDVFLFFTYLYCTTYYGLQLVPDRSILVPTAHDEPPIYFSIFDRLFRLPKRLLFLTVEEKEFVCRRFSLDDDCGEVVGIGIGQLADSSPSQELRTGSAPEPDSLNEIGDDPFILYVGRVDPSKGCEELIEFFMSYVSQAPESRVHLVFAGYPAMPLPDHPKIHFLGYLSEQEKAVWIGRSLLLVAPSPYESLCIAALEAWTASKPILANGRCLVLAGQCRRSQGGLWYRNREEFVECLSVLVSDPALRERLGASGRSFVKREYDWDTVLDAYMSNIRNVIPARPVAVSPAS